MRIGHYLRQRNLLLAVAESCTGGLISHRITNIPGSSDYFLGGVTAYANQAKERLLGVSHQTLSNYGAVSQGTVLEMARGVRQIFSVDYPLERIIGLSVSGIAGPTGGTPEKPVGLVWIGLSAAKGDFSQHFLFKGNRVQIKDQTADAALQILADFLQTRES